MILELNSSVEFNPEIFVFGKKRFFCAKISRTLRFSIVQVDGFYLLHVRHLGIYCSSTF